MIPALLDKLVRNRCDEPILLLSAAVHLDLSVPLAVLPWQKSRQQQPPRYHSRRLVEACDAFVRAIVTVYLEFNGATAITVMQKGMQVVEPCCALEICDR